MLTILGPSKTIDTSPHGITDIHTLPHYLDQAEELVQLVRKLSPRQLKSQMQVSDKLAELTIERYAGWHRANTLKEGQQAILAFMGEVFNGLKARTLSEKDLRFAQDHVRILSGLYGVLRPLDLILPYRLEMGTKLKNPSGNNLYDYWKDVIPERVAQDTGNQVPPVLINLASLEYFRSILPRSFPHEVITPVFKESTGEGYRNVTIYAKKARGMMLRFIILHRITEPENLKAFDEEGYGFDPHLSTATEWVFTR